LWVPLGHKKADKARNQEGTLKGCPYLSRQMPALPAPMSHFIPLDALESHPAEPGTFDIWLPNPVMGRALFLRLPLDCGWTFEFDPAEAIAFRYLVYRDRMWVREGTASMLAIRADGVRVEVNLAVKPWQPRIPECYSIREAPRERLFWRWLQAEREEAITSRCSRTERQMRIWWRANNARRRPNLAAQARGSPPDGPAQSDVERLLWSLHCH